MARDKDRTTSQNERPTRIDAKYFERNLLSEIPVSKRLNAAGVGRLHVFLNERRFTSYSVFNTICCNHIIFPTVYPEIVSIIFRSVDFNSKC